MITFQKNALGGSRYEKVNFYFDGSNLAGWSCGRRNVNTFLGPGLCVCTRARGSLLAALGRA